MDKKRSKSYILFYFVKRIDFVEKGWLPPKTFNEGWPPLDCGGTCKQTHSTKSNAGTWGTLEGLVKQKLEKHATNQRNLQNRLKTSQNQISPESFWKFEIASDDH